MRRQGRPRVWKTCKTCGHRGRVDEDFYVWRDRGRRRVSALCRECVCERQRARYARVQADPYLRQLELQRKRKWESLTRKREANAERCRRYRERLKRERPEVYHQQLEDARIRNSKRTEGRIAAKRAHVREPRTPELDPEPLIRFLKRHRLAAMPGTDGRIVYRLLYENGQRVTVKAADRIITKLGGALSNVYPELYPLEQAS